MFLPLPARRVPAGWAVRGVRFDVRADVLTLRSMLSPAAYRVLATEGVLRAHASLIDTFYVDAYDWLRAQARRRVPGAVGRYPIWCWAQIRRSDLLHNVRSTARLDPGSVLVVCRIGRERCLLTAYDDWHSVLNGSPLVPWPTVAHPDRDDAERWARWERCLDEAYEDVNRQLAKAGVPRQPVSGWPTGLRKSIGQGWEHIFDLDAYPPDEYWRATVEELHADDVVAAVRPVRWL